MIFRNEDLILTIYLDFNIQIYEYTIGQGPFL